MIDRNEDDGTPPPKRYLVWLGGSAALGAWFGMLYFMFGDVL